MQWVSRKILLAILVILTLGGCALTRPPLKLENSVITGYNEVWSGEVQIRGVVTVKKAARLTIEPGTRIVFVPYDADSDGLGDSELMVEGRLRARGTAAAPILFTSGAERPRPGDWKSVNFDFARQAEIDHVISEYANSGLRIHSTWASVTNSELRYNIDGLRFSTVNLLAAGNRIHDNVHGIRYEERKSIARLHHNDIRDNDIGLFVVTRSEDKARIEYNNITANRQYNVKLGRQQHGKVTLPNNWWGSTDLATIEQTFLDKHVDQSVGQVRAPNPLAEPIVPGDWERFEEAER